MAGAPRNDNAHPQRRDGDRLGRRHQIACLHARRRRGLRRRHTELRRPLLHRRRRHDDRRRGQNGHARPGQHPLAPVQRADEQGPDRRGRQPGLLQLLALRIPADLPRRRGSGAALRPRCAIGTVALGRHHAGRPVDGPPRLARPAGRGRHARVHRADVPLRPLVHQERPSRRIRLGRSRRRKGDDRGAGTDRTRRAASLRPPVRHGLSRADRHLQRIPAARQPRRGQSTRPRLADPRGAIRDRIPRDHPPPRPHADRLAGPSRPAVGSFHHRPRGTPKPTSRALPKPERPWRTARLCSLAAASR
jgi:hypothetical protein